MNQECGSPENEDTCIVSVMLGSTSEKWTAAGSELWLCETVSLQGFRFAGRRFWTLSWDSLQGVFLGGVGDDKCHVVCLQP